MRTFFLFINNQWHRYVSNIIQQFATFKRKRRCQNIVYAVSSINNSTSKIFVKIKIDYVFLLKLHTSKYHQNESLCDTSTIRRRNVWIGCAWPESGYRRKGNYCIYCLKKFNGCNQTKLSAITYILNLLNKMSSRSP